MSLSIIDHDDLLDDELRRLAERRLLFALSRFDSRIARLELTVTAGRDSGGADHKVCRITVTLLRMDKVVISDTDSDLPQCLSRAAEKAGRAVARAVERSQQFGLSRPIVPQR